MPSHSLEKTLLECGYNTYNDVMRINYKLIVIVLLITVLPLVIYSTAGHQKSTKVFENSYSSTLYNYEVQYPSTWELTEYDWKYDYTSDKFIRTINLSKHRVNPDNKPDAEITIGTAQVYSTSGALCANEHCIFDLGKLEINSELQADEFTGIDRTNPTNQYDSYILYRFSIPYAKIDTLGQPLRITGQYIDENDKQEIIKILKTFIKT